MSVTDVKSDYDVSASVDYLLFGVGAKKEKHRAAGTNRLQPGFYCDAPSVEAFVTLADALARKNSRKIQAQSYVLSFPPQEFDVTRQADLQGVGDAGFLFAKKMHPNSPCLVVVHADGIGRAAHAHIKVANHNYVTGQALRDYRVHWQVKKVNDELMRDLGMHVLETQSKQPTDDWVLRRTSLPEFEQQLGDLCAEAKVEALAETLTAPSPNMVLFTEHFVTGCKARGIEVIAGEYVVKSGNRTNKQKGDTAVGFTFKMRDGTTYERRVRRRKASVLSSEFTYDAIAVELDTELAPLMPRPAPAVIPVSRRATRAHTIQEPMTTTSTVDAAPSPASGAQNRSTAAPLPLQIGPVLNSSESWEKDMAAILDLAQSQAQPLTDNMIAAFLRDKDRGTATHSARIPPVSKAAIQAEPDRRERITQRPTVTHKDLRARDAKTPKVAATQEPAGELVQRALAKTERVTVIAASPPVPSTTAPKTDLQLAEKRRLQNLATLRAQLADELDTKPSRGAIAPELGT